ncbi:MAG: aconitate hydratase AcnA [Opitutales bacterium]|nr:aconitate hydratase AcnA [Opitutales bacterium]
MHNELGTLRVLQGSEGSAGNYHSLPVLQDLGYGDLLRLPVSIRVVLESLVRNCDGKTVTEQDVKALASWNASVPSDAEIPFVVARIILQDFTGVPLLVDLAAMRDAVADLGHDPQAIEPLVPVDLVVDHSVQVDQAGSPEAFRANLRFEFERNRERYEFLKWGQQAFQTFSVVPPAVGIVHQVNLEHLAQVVFEKDAEKGPLLYPDTLVGTDSHTTMINGLGVVGWGVGGIEAEAGMLGQPVYFQTPEVIGVNLHGSLPQGMTATDLTLRITELLRAEGVVGKFVEFHGEGAANLSLADRATIANMAPEYGATMGYFPVDESTLEYLRMTGRPKERVSLIRDYFEAQDLFGMPEAGSIDYTKTIDFDLGDTQPSVAGPRRPQERIEISDLKERFQGMLTDEVSAGGFGLETEVLSTREKVGLNGSSSEIGHGSVLIAAITSCTNTSNPSVMLAAGLVAKKAVERGLAMNPVTKVSLAPGSRVVSDYLKETGLQPYLDQLGFHLVGYGCTTCIGNSGPLSVEVEKALSQGGLVAASVLSGNRNFEARVHGSIKANFLMSPPLVVAYALAGTVDVDLSNDPIGTGSDGEPVYLRDLWPGTEEIEECMARGIRPEMFREKYDSVQDANPEWNEVDAPSGEIFAWNESSTYVQKPPFFDNFAMDPEPIVSISGMRPLALLGDSVTTDHISPAGAIPGDGPAGCFLRDKGVEASDFNSFGSRRGNDRVMTRGTFANVRIKNRLAGGKEGGYTKFMPDGEEMPIHDACQKYAERGEPLIVFAGIDYGMGSSRDWAAKGTSLLGVKAVVAKSFERIHRSNLLGMGVLPLEFEDGSDAISLGLDGTETFSLPDLADDLRPGQNLSLTISRANGSTEKVSLRVRIDTAIEVEYYRHGGILPFVLRQILREF